MLMESSDGGVTWTPVEAPSLGGGGVLIDLSVDFGVAGVLVTGAKPFRWYARGAWTILAVRASVGTAPTGASVIVDVNKNGTTIFTTQSSRPTIAVSTNTALNSADPEIDTLANGDYLTLDVDQIGSTEPGQNLTVQVWLEST
jgi:hypothetical protein